MLTKDDIKQISNLFDKFEAKIDKKFDTFENKLDNKFDDFAIIVKTSLDSKPDREEMEARFDVLENRMDTFENKLDILSFRVEQNHSRRIEILEDDVRQVKTKLQMQ